MSTGGKLTDYFGRRRSKIRKGMKENKGIQMISATNECLNSSTTATNLTLNSTTTSTSIKSSPLPKRAKALTPSEPQPNKSVGKKKKPPIQSYLDFGQKSTITQCKECGMAYHVGMKVDEETHKKFHKVRNQDTQLGITCNTNFHAEMEKLKLAHCAHQDTLRRWILQLGTFDTTSSYWKEKLKRVFRVMELSLGLCEGSIFTNYSKIILCVTSDIKESKGKIIGCILVTCAVPATPQIEGSSQQSFAKLGVSFVWVAEKERRKRVATTLLDKARTTILVDEEVLVSDVAFSIPSEEGKSFAKMYTGKEDFLTFNPMNVNSLGEFE
eukprot:m.16508 g.16508  ORF g.16508 m.16508 type:complete len:326 (-) comp4629_c0_seq2:475-1452(-)